ncbi:hypothetical protein [Methanohalophilus sp.]|nr:hypothetical protein [Methanohalophilus sp.]
MEPLTAFAIGIFVFALMIISTAVFLKMASEMEAVTMSKKKP